MTCDRFNEGFFPENLFQIRGYAAQAASKPARGTSDVQTTTLPNKLVVASAEAATPISRVSILVR